MYGFLWRHIPGPWVAKFAVFAFGTFGIVFLLFQYAFPAVEPHLPWSKDTVGTTVQQQVVGDYGSGAGSASTPGTGTGGATSTAPAAASSSALPGD